MHARVFKAYNRLYEDNYLKAPVDPKRYLEFEGKIHCLEGLLTTPAIDPRLLVEESCDFSPNTGKPPWHIPHSSPYAGQLAAAHEAFEEPNAERMRRAQEDIAAGRTRPIEDLIRAIDDGVNHDQG